MGNGLRAGIRAAWGISPRLYASVATLTLPFAERLDRLERLDDLIATAERRRDASLRELDRRGAILGHAVRRTVDTIENDKLKVIEGHKTRARHDE
jgi:hypothetical protein